MVATKYAVFLSGIHHCPSRLEVSEIRIDRNCGTRALRTRLETPTWKNSLGVRTQARGAGPLYFWRDTELTARAS